MKYELAPLHPISAPVRDEFDALVDDIAAERAARADRIARRHDYRRKPRCRYAAGVGGHMLSSPAETWICVCSVRQPASAAPFPRTGRGDCGECSGLGEGAAGVPP